MTKVKGKVAAIETIFNEFNQVIGYRAIIEFETAPLLTIGECEIKQ